MKTQSSEIRDTCFNETKWMKNIMNKLQYAYENIYNNSFFVVRNYHFETYPQKIKQFIVHFSIYFT